MNRFYLASLFCITFFLPHILWAKHFDNHYKTDIEYLDKETKFTTKAFIKKNKIVGKVIYRYAHQDCWIDWLFVHPDHRRKGFGRNLLQKAMKTLKTCGCKKIYLKAVDESFVAYYRGAGFKKISEADFFGNILMMWEQEFD